jgi:3D (Asp-Asp-Asp) domain-containing protein
MYTNPRVSASLALFGMLYNLVFSSANALEIDKNIAELMPADGLATVQGQALIQSSNPDTLKVVAQKLVAVTAYSSTADQTDSTPFITASGSDVRDGIVACNFLRFGTKVRFPQLYGDKIFVVEDRMALKNSHKIDIWFTTRNEAKEFGVKYLQVEILES